MAALNRHYADENFSLDQIFLHVKPLLPEGIPYEALIMQAKASYGAKFNFIRQQIINALFDNNPSALAQALRKLVTLVNRAATTIKMQQRLRLAQTHTKKSTMPLKAENMATAITTKENAILRPALNPQVCKVQDELRLEQEASKSANVSAKTFRISKMQNNNDLDEYNLKHVQSMRSMHQKRYLQDCMFASIVRLLLEDHYRLLQRDLDIKHANHLRVDSVTKH